METNTTARQGTNAIPPKAGRRQLQPLVRLTLPGTHPNELPLPQRAAGRPPHQPLSEWLAPRSTLPVNKGRWALTSAPQRGAPNAPRPGVAMNPTSPMPATLRQKGFSLDVGVQPNGSRLSCGRLARRRKSSGRTSRARQGTTQRLPLKRERPPASKRLLGARLIRAALSRYMNRSHNTNDRAGDNERTADATEGGIRGGAIRLPRDPDPEGQLVCKPATGGTSQAADC